MSWKGASSQRHVKAGLNLNDDVAVCQNLVPLVNIKIAGKWMFIPLKMVLIGIDPYPCNFWPPCDILRLMMKIHILDSAAARQSLWIWIRQHPSHVRKSFKALLPATKGRGFRRDVRDVIMLITLR